MRRWIICMPILLGLLTGCQSIEDKRSDAREAYTYVVENNISEHVYRDTTKIEALEAYEGGEKSKVFVKDEYTYYEEIGILREESYADFPEGFDDKGLIELLGVEAKDFLIQATNLAEDEAIEKVINEYGLYAINQYGKPMLLVGNSSLKFKDEALQSKIEKICGDQLLIATISQGSNHQLVELVYPSYWKIQRYGFQDRQTGYYQLFMDLEGNIEKVKFILAYDDEQDGTLVKDKLTHLKKVLEEVSGEPLDTVKVEEAIISNIESKHKDSKGVLGDWNYTVTYLGANDYIQGMTVVEFQ
ncbi:MAG: hypothetical protein E7231_11335 [Cellulosilyticum sp.]|nr:hypothetical protein [Cellulosilyticum sp.]